MGIGNRIGDVDRIYEYKYRNEASLPQPHYLIGVSYEGKIGKAVLEFLDESGERYIKVIDPTGHRPYFLTDEPPSVLKQEKLAPHSKYIHEIDEVQRINPLTMEKVRLTRVITNDPQAVRVLREKVRRAWEAKIKYYVNYIYDSSLIPGMRYVIEAGNGGSPRISLVKPSIPSDLMKSIHKLFAGESKDALKLAEEFLILFEEMPPRAKKVAIDIEVYTPVRGRVPAPRLAEYPVISIALVGSDGLKKVLVLGRKFKHDFEFMMEEYPAGAEVEVFDSEAALILEAFRLISQYPVVVTYNGDNFDLTYLYIRAIRLGIPRSYVPITLGKEIAKLETGLHIDLYKFFSNRAVKNYAFGGKYQEEKLDAVSSALLGVSKIGIEEGVGDISASLLIAYNFRDAEITYRLMEFNNELVWKLMTLLARISKTPYEDICRRQISNWIQNQFHWEHRRLNYLIVNKEDIQRVVRSTTTKAVIEGKKYAGALVIEPPLGVFFKVAVLDIASLYPSIIKKYNLSYETVDTNWCREKEEIVDERGTRIHTVCKDKPGLTAQITGMLRDFRVKIYKRRSKDKSLGPELLAWYDVVQRAIKVFINASYGVFGDEKFSLYSPAVAESVTALGRKSFTSIVLKASQLGMKVLYGDTDSIFIWSPTKEQLTSLQKWVSNELGLEIELDKEFTYVIFTGRKKNYLGRTSSGDVEIKGLVAKKRNAPEFLKELFNEVIAGLKSVDSPQDFVKFMKWLEGRVREYYDGLVNKEVPLESLAIKTALTKDPQHYTKNKPPHVKAALALQQYKVNVQVGDIISYVIIKGKDGYKPIQIAKLYEIDPDKYLERIKSGFEQLLTALGIKWEDIVGRKSARLGFRSYSGSSTV